MEGSSEGIAGPPGVLRGREWKLEGGLAAAAWPMPMLMPAADRAGAPCCRPCAVAVEEDAPEEMQE